MEASYGLTIPYRKSIKICLLGQGFDEEIILAFADSRGISLVRAIYTEMSIRGDQASQRNRALQKERRAHRSIKKRQRAHGKEKENSPLKRLWLAPSHYFQRDSIHPFAATSPRQARQISEMSTYL